MLYLFVFTIIIFLFIYLILLLHNKYQFNLYIEFWKFKFSLKCNNSLKDKKHPKKK